MNPTRETEQPKELLPLPSVLFLPRSAKPAARTSSTGRDAVVLLHPAALGKPRCATPDCARLALQLRRSSGGRWLWWCVRCDPGRGPSAAAGVLR